MTALRSVTITISNLLTSDVYLAKSYPDSDFDDDGNRELYEAPVYKVFIEGKDDAGVAVKKEWKALRFMPYWNDPKVPDPRYPTKGWVNAGLQFLAKRAAPSYDPDYRIQNTVSHYFGSIRIKGRFLIHAGPATMVTPHGETPWGSAGCVEIVGSFDDFRRDIIGLSGSKESDIHEGMKAIVGARKLLIQVDLATPPNFRSMVSTQSW